MPVPRALLLVLVPLVLAGCAEEAPPEGDATSAPSAQHVESFDIPAGGSIEYKLRVAKGAQVDFTWTADRALTYDFHGDTGATGYQSHEKGTAVTDSDEWTAPFSGNHGWYWKNNHREAVRVTLATEGDYTVVGLV